MKPSPKAAVEPCRRSWISTTDKETKTMTPKKQGIRIASNTDKNITINNKTYTLQSLKLHSSSVEYSLNWLLHTCVIYANL